MGREGRHLSYSALHARVRRLRGAPQRCERCGAADAGRYHWASKTGRYYDVYDYERLCCLCHARYDAYRRRRQKGANTTPLHLSPRGTGS